MAYKTRSIVGKSRFTLIAMTFPATRGLPRSAVPMAGQRASTYSPTVQDGAAAGIMWWVGCL